VSAEAGGDLTLRKLKNTRWFFMSEYKAQSPSRRAGFINAREEMAQKPIPDLIDLLASPDLRTRFFAEMCLRDATNT